MTATSYAAALASIATEPEPAREIDPHLLHEKYRDEQTAYCHTCGTPLT